jgi:hypothetical protein
VTVQLVGAVQRGQHCNGDQTAIALGQFRLFPDITEQHFVAQLAELRDEFISGFLR